jgi:ABC-2 type transport system ATP-binding protein
VVILSKGRVVADDSIDRLRELMQLPSLGDIFAQLTEKRDTAAAADRIIEVMQA